jgi:predicted Holliday junction resolvase-like endonuclease
MPTDGLLVELTKFFKAARHLWGRCPRCSELFRLSEAAISFGEKAPADWLTKVERQRVALDQKRDVLDEHQAELEGHEAEVRGREKYVAQRERHIDRDAKRLAQEYMNDSTKMRTVLRQARQDAVLRSRATLLGKLFERLGPFLQRFNHDPRDVRAIMDPIDYVVFDGLTDKRVVDRITFVEVKAGTSTTSPTQRSIMKAVSDGRVDSEVWQFGERGIPIHQQLMRTTGARRVPPLDSDDPE